MEAASAASSPDDLFLRMEAAGVMLRIDPSVTPTMAKTPTLAQWELDLLRSIERVVRLGHVRGVEPGRIELDEGDAAIRQGCGGHPLRRFRAAVPAAGPDLGRRGDHDSAGPGGLPVPGGGTDRVRGGNPRR